MNDNLPVHVDASLGEIGTITYATEVIAIIAGLAASEIDGVSAMGTTSSIADILGRNRKPITKGVKVEVGSEEASVDLTFSVEYGKPIQRVCRDVQESVRKSIETMTGLHVVKVDVHVLGVSFERETQQLAESAQAANLSLDSGKRGQPVRARKEPETAKPREAAPQPDSEAAQDVDAPEVAAQPARAEEPETANKLPPDAESAQEPAVFASALTAEKHEELSELVEDAASDTLLVNDDSDEDVDDLAELTLIEDIDIDGDLLSVEKLDADGGEGSESPK